MKHFLFLSFTIILFVFLAACNISPEKVGLHTQEATKTTIKISTITPTISTTELPAPTHIATIKHTPSPTLTPGPDRWCPVWPETIDTIPNRYPVDYKWNEDDNMWGRASFVISDFIFFPPASIFEDFKVNSILCPNLYSYANDMFGPIEFRNPKNGKIEEFIAREVSWSEWYEFRCLTYCGNDGGASLIFDRYRELTEPEKTCLMMEEASIQSPFYGPRKLNDLTLEETFDLLTKSFGNPDRSPYCSNFDPEHEDYLVLFRQDRSYRLGSAVERALP